MQQSQNTVQNDSEVHIPFMDSKSFLQEKQCVGKSIKDFMEYTI